LSEGRKEKIEFALVSFMVAIRVGVGTVSKVERG
jgi:hypothetical protein